MKGIKQMMTCWCAVQCPCVDCEELYINAWQPLTSTVLYLIFLSASSSWFSCRAG